MESGRQKYIEEQAEKISHDSEQFQLTHATYICTARVKDDVIKHHQKEYDDLQDKMKRRMRRKENIDIEKEELQGLKSIIDNKVFYIDVEYIGPKDTEDMTDITEARVIKTRSRLVISLPKKLKEQIYNDDNSPNYGVIREIRELMAHELGHIVLHTEELLENEGTQGSKDIKDLDKEDEADYFAEVLLKLREERDEKIRREGKIHRP